MVNCKKTLIEMDKVEIDDKFSVYKENKVVIWGTALNAEKCAKILEKYGIQIFAYCDNAPEKWGKTFQNKKILSPQQLYQLCKEEGVLLQIASTYYEDIREQVKAYPLKSILVYKELYVIDECMEIAEMYGICGNLILKTIKQQYDLFRWIFEQDKYRLENIQFEYGDNSEKKVYAEEWALNENSLIREKMEYELEKILPQMKKKYGLSVCAICKNEGAYIVEWLEYHMMVGIEHFYIYDNESTDRMEDIIRDYIEKGIVTYAKWPGKGQQVYAYSDACRRYQYESKYIAFIDMDEFLVPVDEEQLLPVVERIFQRHKGVGGIGVNWRTYGTSFHEDKMPGLLFENYKYRANDFSDMNTLIKSICNPRCVMGFENMTSHAPSYKEGYHCISENGSYIPDIAFFDGVCKKIRINHYHTKSANEYRVRRHNGDACTGADYSEEEIEILLKATETTCNEVYDPIMDRYVEKLRKRL